MDIELTDLSKLLHDRLAMKIVNRDGGHKGATAVYRNLSSVLLHECCRFRTNFALSQFCERPGYFPYSLQEVAVNIL